MTRSHRRFAATLAAGLALLALPAAAHAGATPGAGYGGGSSLPPEARTGSVAYLAAAVAADGRSARVTGYLTSTCRSGKARGHVGTSQRFARTFALTPEGRLTGTAKTLRYLYGAVGARPMGRATVDLQFDGAAASGTVRMRVRGRNAGKRIACDERIAVALRAPAADASAAAPAPAGAELVGPTGQRYRGAPGTIVMRTSSTGRRVLIQAGLALRCGTGGRLDYLPNIDRSVKVAADGSFRVRDRWVIRFRGGDRTVGTVRIDGRFTAQGVTGRVSARADYRLKRSRDYTCRSGGVAFTAVR